MLSLVDLKKKSIFMEEGDHTSVTSRVMAPSIPAYLKMQQRTAQDDDGRWRGLVAS